MTRLLIVAGTRVERIWDYRKRCRFVARRMEPEPVRAGTVRSVGKDLFGKTCSLVDWDEGGQSMLDNRDLRIVR